MGSCQYHLWIMVVLCLLCRPSEGLSLSLVNKPAEQSSTQGSGNAGRAIDSDRNTFSHTRCEGDQWWRVDLQATHVLTKITIVNRGNCCGERLAGAVVRAGCNIDHTQNTAIGSPVITSQATDGAVIDFIPASTISARYVSVELTGRCLHMAEVMIEQAADASLPINLLNKPTNQKTTFNSQVTADRAVDGNEDTFSHTECNGDQWWRVDLQATYLLAKIIIVNRKNCCGARLQGAIVRAGLSSDHSENRMIGSSVTSSQATNGAVIDFVAVPTVSARYVSVELSGACLHLAEVMIEEAVDAVSLIVADVDSESVTLSWFMRSCPDYYSINYALSNRDGCENITQLMYNQHCMCLGTSSVTTISGLLPNSMYSVQIKAYVNGVYGPTTSVNFTTSTSKPTNQTAQVAVQNRTQRSLSFSWSPPPCGGRGGIITGYAYLLSKLGSESITVVNSTAPAHGEVTIDELIPFTNYSFQVAAQTVRGIGPYSEVVTTRTLEAAPTVPLNVSIREVDNVSLLFVWSEPDPPQGIITHYNVRYWRSGENGTAKTIYSITQLMHRVVGLESSTTYLVQVQAVTSVDEGPWSDAIGATTKIGVPGPVGNLRWTERMETSVTLGWNIPLQPRGQIKMYKVDCKVLERPYQPGFNAQGTYKGENVTTDPKFKQTNLDPGTKYEFRVSAVNQKFTGAHEIVQVYTKPQSDPPAPPQPTKFQDEFTDTTVTVGVITSLSSGDRFINSYIVHVKRTDTSSMEKRDTFSPKHYDDSAGDYIAAEMLKHEVQDKFVVGDSNMYGPYWNAPLQTGAAYEIRIGAASKGNATEVSVAFSDPIHVTVMSPPSSLGVVVAVVMVIAIVVIIIIIIIVVYKRRRSNQAKQPSNVDEVLRSADIPFDNKEDKQGCHSNTYIESDGADKMCDLPNAARPEPAPKPRQHQPDRNADRGDKRVKFTQPAPVRVEKLTEYIHMRESAGKHGFQEDYKTLPDEQLHPWTVAQKAVNRQKNRYVNVVAYDHSRVVLEPTKDDPHSDYINACYIDGYKMKDKYIASQGPNKASLRDIWRMVWQQNVTKIIMLTNPVENGKVKCMQYWANTGSATYSDIVVSTDKEEVFLDYTIRNFSIHQVGSEDSGRSVKQFHYTTWPDMKPPEYPAPLLNFMRVVNADHNHGRTVVHCSAGVGRTGTYIALDAMLEQVKHEGQVDVLGFIYQMRQQRIKMVQTPEQYKFIFDALLAASLTGDTVYNDTNFRQKLSALKKVEAGAQKTGMEKQFETLIKLGASSSRGSSRERSGQLPENLQKNRYPDFVPSDRTRPYLMTRVHEGTDYINANFLSGYRKKNRYIGTQMPLPNTVADFWGMVYDHKATCIVMLNPLDAGDETMGCYWPEEGSIELGRFVVELSEATANIGVTIRRFTLVNKQAESEAARTVTQFQYLDWPSEEEVPQSLRGLLTLLELTQKHHEDTGPIIVHCIDGLGRTAAYCTLMAVLEQYQAEKAVDVFHAVHRLRMINHNMMYSVDQYGMCYDVFQTFLDSSSIYENYTP